MRCPKRDIILIYLTLINSALKYFWAYFGRGGGEERDRQGKF